MSQGGKEVGAFYFAVFRVPSGDYARNVSWDLEKVDDRQSFSTKSCALMAMEKAVRGKNIQSYDQWIMWTTRSGDLFFFRCELDDRLCEHKDQVWTSASANKTNAGEGKVDVPGISLLSHPSPMTHLMNARTSVRTCIRFYIYCSRLLPNAISAHFWAQPIHFDRSRPLTPISGPSHTHYFQHHLPIFKRHVINLPPTYVQLGTHVRMFVHDFSSYFLLSRTNAYVIPYVPFGNICKFVFTIWSILFVSNVRIIYIYLDSAFGS